MDAPQSSTDRQIVSAQTSVLNLAAYHFVSIPSPEELRKTIRQRAGDLRIKGTVLISHEGINLFVAAQESAARQFFEWLKSLPGLQALHAKESWTDYQPFRRMLVKLKKEIIAFGIDQIDPAHYTSSKITPEELRQWLRDGRPLQLLDVRNDYEVDVGTFQNAHPIEIDHFRNFPEAIDKLPQSWKEQPVVMFCTGGIRCEKAGPWMEQRGFRHVLQLDGGILNYFEKCGGEFYQGDCFVFDQRVAVRPDLTHSDKSLCFACQHVLTQEQMQSDLYQPGKHCPHCYLSPLDAMERKRAAKESRMRDYLERQPGCQPYCSERSIHVPRRLAGMPLLDFLEQWIPGRSRSHWMEAIESGRLVDGHLHSVAPDRIVSEGQKLLHREPDTIEPPVSSAIHLVYQSDTWLVLDKPAPLPVHACGRYYKNTLEAAMQHAYHPEKIRLVHRLDANTSGLLVAARRTTAARYLQQQFSDRSVEKTYLAAVSGHPTEDCWECRIPISDQTGPFGSRSIASVDSSQPTHQALTTFQVLHRRSDGTSLLKAIPRTGRTNQIRIHLWESGFPIIGDPLYLPDRKLGDGSTLPIEQPSMQLHSLEISLLDPETKTRRSFVSQQVPQWASHPSG
jgi:UPF0176 protein